MDSSLFGITISLIAYLLVAKIQEKTKISVLNPLLFGGILIIVFLLVFNIKLEDYLIGGNMISSLIGPATISLAIPLYKNIDRIKQDSLLILTAITSAIISHFIVLIMVISILKINPDVALSLIAKSITTPLAVDVTRSLAGIEEITVTVVLITGIFGASISPLVNKIFKINNDKAIGLALGSSAHAVGTSKAVANNQEQGSYSSIALILTGISTVILSPLMAYILKIFL